MASGEDFEMNSFDSPMFKDMSVTQIEGEPTPAHSTPAPVDPKTKGKSAPKPEPSDNRPRIVVFERRIEDELVRITEPAAIKFASQRLSVSILDAENKIVETVSLNIS